jgi:mannose-6-phosphate isomerase
MSRDPRFLKPWKLLPHRVGRFYLGGKLLEEFRGTRPEQAVDGDHPEDWVGSATRAWTPPDRPPTDEGLSDVEIGGVAQRVADLLAEDPVAVAGQDVVDRFGVTTGVLVKLLDAAVRLPVHCHPNRDFARRHLDSPFGKAEAWIVLRTRAGDGELPPTVRIGFRRDVGRDELVDWIEGGRTDELLGAMHERPTTAGDVWFIPPGVPHAIGAGIFMLEVEEPTDFSIVAETRDIPIDPSDAHLRLGWDVTIDAFDRSGHEDARVDALRLRSPASEAGGGRIDLTDDRAAPYFHAEALTIGGGTGRPFDRAALIIAAVTDGTGILRTPAGELPLRGGVTFALPAAATATAEVEGSGSLRLIACRAPQTPT